VTLPVGRRVIAVVPDLFFATKIASTAKMSGVELELVPAARAVARMAQAPASLAILDLHAKDAMTLVSALKAAAPTVPVVGFFSHVEIAIRNQAIAAGADAALPRSLFVTKLAALLSRGLEALSEPAPGMIA
jgi:DNA-binding NarL/FixJ family response regulator